MSEHAPVEGRRHLPKPVAAALVVVAVVVALGVLLPVLAFFLFAMSGAEIG